MTELLSDIRQEQQQHQQVAPDQPWVQPELGVFVVHNKQRPKLAQLPDDILRDRCVLTLTLLLLCSMFVAPCFMHACCYFVMCTGVDH